MWQTQTFVGKLLLQEQRDQATSTLAPELFLFLQFKERVSGLYVPGPKTELRWCVVSNL